MPVISCVFSVLFCVASVSSVIGFTVATQQVLGEELGNKDSTVVPFQSPEQTNAAIDKSVDFAVSFLKNRGQTGSGAFSPETGVAVTSLCVRAILEHRPSDIDSPAVKKAIEFILANVKTDGGIYATGSMYRN